jgi:hypothetical protein
VNKFCVSIVLFMHVIYGFFWMHLLCMHCILLQPYSFLQMHYNIAVFPFRSYIAWSILDITVLLCVPSCVPVFPYSHNIFYTSSVICSFLETKVYMTSFSPHTIFLLQSFNLLKINQLYKFVDSPVCMCINISWFCYGAIPGKVVILCY